MTNYLNIFQHSLQRTGEWLRAIAADLGWDDHDAYHGLRAVLHALRDRLPVEECVHLGAQMPMVIRGMYYEGWTPKNKPVKMKTQDEFFDRIRKQFDVEDAETLDVEALVNAVFRVLSTHIDFGEIEDVKQNFPKDLQHLWPKAA